jgi:hypothetical protein
VGRINNGVDYPLVTLAAAREWALATLRDMTAGVDPKDKAEAARLAEERQKANSFATVAERNLLSGMFASCALSSARLKAVFMGHCAGRLWARNIALR